MTAWANGTDLRWQSETLCVMLNAQLFFGLFLVVCRWLSEGDASEPIARSPSAGCLLRHFSDWICKLDAGSRKYLPGFALAHDWAFSWPARTRRRGGSQPGHRVLRRSG